MNAPMSILLSLATVFAGGAAALGGDLLDPFQQSAPADDCVLAVCLGGGNETADPGNGTEAPDEPDNGTAEPEPEPEPAHDNETGDGHYHHHHYHNGTGAADGSEADGNETEEPAGPQDVYFCTTGVMLLGESYEQTWEVQEGYELFTLDWHFQSLGLGLLMEPDVSVRLTDGAGAVVFEASGGDATSFFLDTDDLSQYAVGEWTFTVSGGELAADQGLVGHVNY